MIIEFQVRSAVFANQLVSRLRSGPLCVLEEFELDGHRHIVSFLEVTEDARFERGPTDLDVNLGDGATVEIAATAVRYVQPLRIEATRLTTLAAAGPQPVQADQTLDISITFELTMALDDGAPELRTTFVEANLGVLDLVPEIAAEIRQRLEELELPTIALDVSAITGLVGADVTNAGIVVSEAGAFVCIRLGVKEGDDPSATWLRFFTRPPRDRLGDRDWSMFIDREILMSTAETRAAIELGNQDALELVGDPHASWTAAGPFVVLDLRGKIKDACRCFGVPIDLDLDVRVTTQFSRPRRGVLRTTTSVSWDASNWDVACCAATAGLVVGLAAGLLTGPMGGLLAGLAVVAGGFVFAAFYTPADVLPAPPECEQRSDTQVRCDQRIEIDAGVGAMSFDQLSGQRDGLLLSGGIAPQVALAQARLRTDDTTPFGWRIEGDCGYYAIDNHARVRLDRDGDVPLELCSATIVDDPLGVYSPAHILREVVVTPTLSPEFLADPYPCQLLVRTNGGARLITFAPPESLPEEVRAQMLLDVQLQQLECDTRVLPFFEEGEMFIPGFVDPMRGLTEVLTHVLVTRIPAGTAIVASTGERAVARAVASPAGMAHLAVVAPAGAKAAVRLRAAPRAIGPLGAVAVKSVGLARRARIGLTSPAVDVACGHRRGVPTAVIVTRGAVRLYDLSVPNAPSLAGLLTDTRASGALVARSRVLLWGDGGILAWDWEDGRRPRRIWAEPVCDVIAGPAGTLAARGRDCVHVLDGTFEHVETIAAEGITGHAAVRDAIVILRGDVVRRHPLRGDLEPRRRGARAPARATGSTSALPGLHLVRPRDEHGRGVVEVVDAGAVERTVYLDEPWFVGSAVLDDLLIRVEPGGHRFTVDTVLGVRNARYQLAVAAEVRETPGADRPDQDV